MRNPGATTRRGLIVSFLVVAANAAPVAGAAKAKAQKTIVVSVGQQMLWAYKGNKVVLSSYVSTGRAGFDTLLGSFAVLSKLPSQTMEGVIGGEYYNVLANAGVGAIFVTHFQRSRQTAVPLEGMLMIDAKVIDDVDELIEALRALPASAAALVIGHSDTVPAGVAHLGGPLVTIEPTEFDKLFVQVGQHLVHARYGAKRASGSGRLGARSSCLLAMGQTAGKSALGTSNANSAMTAFALLLVSRARLCESWNGIGPASDEVLTATSPLGRWKQREEMTVAASLTTSRTDAHTEPTDVATKAVFIWCTSRSIEKRNPNPGTFSSPS